MIQINYPFNDYKIKTENNVEFIYDEIRRSWFVLTPEEWVRQNILQYITVIKKYPSSLIAVEKEIKVGELKKRFDIVIYKNSLPWMLIECKEMGTKIDEKVLTQILSYHSKLQANYLLLTNGNNSFLWQKIGNDFDEISELPSW